MLDKTRYRNWEDGDVFAHEIKNSGEEYNGRYLILIKCSIVDFDTGELWDDHKGKESFFRVKLTKNKKIPRTKEEIENLEYVKIRLFDYTERYFPYSGSSTRQETEKKRSVVKFYPDEYNYIYVYIIRYWVKRIAHCKDLIYLGNYDILPPKGEYIPFDFCHTGLTPSDVLEKKIIDYYEWYNLKKAGIFTKEASENYKRSIQTFLKVIDESDEMFRNKDN